jgi:hypothetical protein
MKRLHLDANVVRRFLRDDDPKQSPAAHRPMREANEGKVVLVFSVIAVLDVFFLLRKNPQPDAPRDRNAVG